jgi:Na+/H+ antiporter NhaD/arsenite permease-like protein
LGEWATFMALLASLYGVAGGIELQGGLRPGPLGNLIWLTVGALLASVVGTTGASMLLIRPFVRAQAGRQRAAHTVVFFIFLVSNVGGMLLPLGDPPLFLGYLRGVPFLWTWQLWPFWALCVALLLAVFVAIDVWAYRQEPQRAPRPRQPLHLAGGHNLLFFAVLVSIVAFAPTLHLVPWQQSLLMLGVLAVSYLCTPRALYRRNEVTLGPMIEVATVFFAIFATMPDALAVLLAVAPKLGPLGPEALFWTTGGLSAILDNAPCYLSMATLAQGQLHLTGTTLAPLAAHPQGRPLLLAIAAGAVTMGAMTYIGNGPNLMVRAVAQQAKLRPPSFVGYLAWAMVTLLPVLVIARLCGV